MPYVEPRRNQNGEITSYRLSAFHSKVQNEQANRPLIHKE